MNHKQFSILWFLLCTATLITAQATDTYVLNHYGDSMNPNINAGDYSLCTGVENYNEGDVVAFAADGQRISHRVIDIKEDVVVTKGDNNKFSETIDREDIYCTIIYTAQV